MFILKNFIFTIITILGLTIGGVILKNISEVGPKYELLPVNDSSGKVIQKEFVTYKADIWGLVGDIMIGIASSIFISAFIIRLYEDSDRRVFEKRILTYQQDTAKDAIKSAYERILPPEIYKILQQDIFSADVLRKNAKWIYTFTKKENNKYSLKRSISYQLKNISNKRQEEKIQVITLTENKYMKCTSFTLKTKMENEPDYQTIELGQGLKEHSIPLNADQSCEISFTLEQEFAGNFVSETHFTRYPMIGLDITVNYPANCKFLISVNTLSSIPQLITDEEGLKSYSTQGAIYKGQGIEFYLEEKKCLNKLSE